LHEQEKALRLNIYQLFPKSSLINRSLKSRPSWSPDGSTLAYAQKNDFGTMDIWEIAALGGSPHSGSRRY
jgi:Tol biopolymer transport system component